MATRLPSALPAATWPLVNLALNQACTFRRAIHPKNLGWLLWLLLLCPLLALQAQTITSVSPTSGRIGTLVTIRGSNLAGASVTINGTQALKVTDSAAVAQVLVMGGSSSGTMMVGSTNAGNFTVTPHAPAVPSRRNQEVVPDTRTVPSNFGMTVSSSADGLTLLVGAPMEASNLGAAYVFTRPTVRDLWVQESKLPIPPGAGSGIVMGDGVALSANGLTALVSATHAVNSRGTVFVYEKSGTQWTYKTSLYDPTGSLWGKQGGAISISANGKAAVVTAPGEGNTGVVRVYRQDTGVWALDTTLVPGDVDGTQGWMGEAVAMSADGNTFAVAQPGFQWNQGAFWVYKRNAGIWQIHGSALTLGLGQAERAGTSLAINANGTRILSTVPGYANGVGAVMIYVLQSGNWVRQTQPLLPPNTSGDVFYGSSIAMSPDGDRAIIGAPNVLPLGGFYAVSNLLSGTPVQHRVATALRTQYARLGNSLAMDATGTHFFAGVTSEDNDMGVLLEFKADSASDATLKELSVDTGLLTPAFFHGTLAYRLTVPSSLTTLNITARTNQPLATLQMGRGSNNYTSATSGQAKAIALSTGTDTIFIRVISSDGLDTSVTRILLFKMPPPPGNSLRFSGNGEYVRTNTNITNITTQVSIETWIRNENADPAAIGFICSRSEQQFEIQVGGAPGLLRFMPVWGVLLDVQNAIPLNEWTHVAATYNQNTGAAKIYINGIERPYVNAGNSSTFSQLGTDWEVDHFHIGKRPGAPFQFVGRIDEFKVFNRQRSAAEIRADMVRRTATSDPSLVFYYDFDQSIADGNNTQRTLLPDVSDRLMDATLHQFALTGAASNFSTSYAMVVPRLQPANQITASGFTMNWNAPLAGNVSGYVVTVATDAAFTNVVSGYNQLPIGNRSNKAITGIAPGLVYHYRLSAIDSSIMQVGHWAQDSVFVLPAELQLTSLTTNVGAFSPAFDSLTIRYRDTVLFAQRQMTVNATPKNASATMRVRVNNGLWKPLATNTNSDTLGLAVGNNLVEVQVKMGSTDSVVYTIDVFRIGGNNVLLSSVVPSSGLFVNNASPFRNNNLLNVLNSTTDLRITAMAADTGARISMKIDTGSFVSIRAGQPSPIIGLSAGKPSTVVLRVTSADSSVSADYSFTAIRGLAAPGNAINLAGGYIRTIGNNTLFNNGAATIEGWVYWNPATASDVEFITSYGNEIMEIHTGGVGPNGLRFIPTPGVYIDAVGVLPLRKWTHVACVYSAPASQALIYINGQLVPSSSNGPSAPGDPLFVSNSFNTIGLRHDNSFPFHGRLDELKYWREARSQVQILADMANSSPQSNNLVHYINFNQGIARGDNSSSTAIYNASLTDSIGQFYGLDLSDTSAAGAAIDTSRAYQTWTGMASNSFANGANWSLGQAPADTSVLSIPAGAANTPVNVPNGTTINLALIEAPTTLNGTIQVKGMIAGSSKQVNANGATLEYSGSSTQFISGNAFVGNRIDKLIVNNNGTAMLTDTLGIKNSVAVNAGSVLNTQVGRLTLLSDSSRTARIGNSAGTIDGNITVQRFVPGKQARRFSLIASPVYQNLANAWQQQVHITGAGTGGTVCPTLAPHSNGFDATITSAPSIFTYNAASTSGNKWVANTLGTTSQFLQPGTGYRMLIRGPRSQGCGLLDGSIGTTSAVTLQATGAVNNASFNAGSFTRSYPNNAANNWVLIGNPYPSDIDFTGLLAANNSAMGSSYVIYDPQNPATGANANFFSTWNAGSWSNAPTSISGNAGQYIANGQAIFVQSLGNTALNLNFTEAMKAEPSHNGLLRTAQTNGDNAFGWARLLRLGLYRNNVADSSKLDETLLRMSMSNATVSATTIGSLDAQQFNTGTTSIATMKTGTALSIQTRPSPGPAGDTVALRLVSSSSGNVLLQLRELQQMAGIEVVLRDKFANTQQVLQPQQPVSISITADPASQGNNRLELILRPAATLNARFVSVSAQRNENNNQQALVKYTAQEDGAVQSFTVLRSTDGGQQFRPIATQKASSVAGQFGYEATDVQAPINGDILYRIEALNANGSLQLSQIVKLDAAKGNMPLSIVPNPVKDVATIRLQQSANEPQAAQLRLLDLQGRTLLSQTIAPGAQTVMLNLGTLPQGQYRLQVLSQQGQLMATEALQKQ